jgi:hypothetical protein
MSVSAHTDVQWRSTRSQARPYWCKGLTHECMHGQHTNASAKARHSRSTYLSAYITFSMHIAVYKKQEALNQRTSLLLLLSTRASLGTKSKRLPIDVSLYFYYFQHAHRRIQKARSSRSMLHTTFITFHVCFPSRIKTMGSTGMCSKFSTWLTKFLKVFAAQQISSSAIWLNP